MMDGIANFRDFGIYQGAGGRALVRGRLYRSAHHAEATDEDLAALSGLGIGLIADLRKAGERARYPSRRWPDCGAAILERPDRADGTEPPHLSFLLEPGLTPEIVAARMVMFYRESPFDPELVAIFRRYFAALAEADGAVIVHCMAGKDRTGILVALTHHLLGVARGDIMENYLATNVHMPPEERLPNVLATFEEQNGQSVEPDIVLAVLRVRREMLEAALESIAERCGSIDAYLSETLGVTAAMRARLVQRLLD
jgi:protein tyrosine/serine phosphatase